MLDESTRGVIQQLQDCPILWTVCGGWGIDVFLNRKTREHKDLDITIKRHDQLLMQEFLLGRGWQLLKVVSGELHEWRVGDYLELPVHNVWCSHPDFPQHYLEVLFSEVDDTHYKFRRKPSVRLALVDAFCLADVGIPFLAPEIILLFKAKYSKTNPDYQQDYDLCYPQLSDTQKLWLNQAIGEVYGEHDWIV